MGALLRTLPVWAAVLLVADLILGGLALFAIAVGALHYLSAATPDVVKAWLFGVGLLGGTSWAVAMVWRHGPSDSDGYPL